MWLAVSDCPNQCPRDPARRVTLRQCPSPPVQPVMKLSRFLPSSPRTPHLQFQAARRNVCLARSSPIKGHTLPTGPPMYQATECLDCQGAQGVIPDDLNPTAWEAACRNAKGRVETFRNIGGIAKDRRAQGLSVSLPRATGSAAVVAVGLSRFGPLGSLPFGLMPA